MGLPRRLILLCLAAALCATAAMPAHALGAERIVRPVQTYSLASGWSITPSGADAHAVLAESVADPAVPDTTTGYLFGRGNGPIVGEIGFAAPAVPAGETVTGTRLHAYFETGSGRSLAVELRSGSKLLAATIVPAGQAAGWHDLAAWVTPTLGQLGDLRMRATIMGNGSSSDVKVYAAYVVVTTTAPASDATGDAPPTPVDDAQSAAPGTGDPGTGPQPPGAAVTLPVQTLNVARSGVLAVPLTCQMAAGCTGTISTRLIGSAPRSARRRKVNNKKSKGRKRFRLAAGQSKRIPVQLDRRTSRFVRRKGRAKVAVTIAIDGAAPVTKQVTVVQRRTARRRK